MENPEAGAAGCEAEPLDDLRSLEETARFFDVSVPTVRAWLKDGCPVASTGGNGRAYGLSLRAVAEWRHGIAAAEAEEAERKRQADAQLGLALLGAGSLTAGGAEAGGGPMSPKQKAEWLKAEIDAAKLAQMRGELVRADDVRQAMAEALALIRSRVRALPDQMARKLGWSEAVTSQAVALVDGALEDLADALAAIARPEAADDADH